MGIPFLTVRLIRAPRVYFAVKTMDDRLIENVRESLQDQADFGTYLVDGTDPPQGTERLQIYFLPGNWDAFQFLEMSRFINFATAKYPSAVIIYDLENPDCLYAFIELSSPVQERYRVYKRDEVLSSIFEFQMKDLAKCKQIVGLLAEKQSEAFEMVRNEIAASRNIEIKRAVFVERKYLELLEAVGQGRINLDFLGCIKSMNGSFQKLGFYEHFPRIIQTDFKKNSLDLFRAFNDLTSNFTGDFLFYLIYKVLEDTVNNIIFISHGRIILAIKVIAESDQIRPIPIPLSYFEPFQEFITDPKKLASKLYKATGTSTLIYSDDEILKFIYTLADREDTFLIHKLVENLLRFFSRCTAYPKPMTIEIAETLGIDLGTFFLKLPDVLKEVFGVYESLIFFVVNSDIENPVLSVTEVYMDDGRLDQIRTMNRDQFHEFFRENPINKGLKLTRDYLETSQNKKYHAGFAFQWKYINELASLKNIKAVSKLRFFFNHLPMIREISHFFSKMTAAKKLNINEKALDQVEQMVKTREGKDLPVYDMLSAVNSFLLDGIALWEEEEHTIGVPRVQKYKDEGFLGWNLKEIIEYFSNKFP